MLRGHRDGIVAKILAVDQGDQSDDGELDPFSDSVPATVSRFNPLAPEIGS